MTRWEVRDELDELAQDALDASRRIAKVFEMDDSYKKIRGEAGIISCFVFGHPGQPRPRRKYQEQPWRCARCGTWWVSRERFLWGEPDGWSWYRVGAGA